jgi:hypothetical protein
MPAIRHIPFAGTFNDHLNLTDAAGILSKVIPCQCRSRDFKLFGSDLGIPYTLSQHTSGGVESVNKGLPVHEVLRFATTLQCCQSGN